MRLLIVEDNEDDALLVVRNLRGGGIDLDFERVETAAAMSMALTIQPPDIVISDNTMPAFDASSALRLLRDRQIDVPFIVVSGQIGEETAVALMREGAHDFVLKDSLARLLPAVTRELREAEERREQRRTQSALRTSEERFRLVAEHVHDVVFRYRIGPNPHLEYISSAVEAMTGHPPDDLYDAPELIFAMAEPDDRVRMVESWRTPPTQPLVMRWRNADGFTKWIEQRAVAVLDDQGQGIAVEGILRDITTQTLAAVERESLERQLHQVERLDSLGQLAGGIAHDFNNLLGVISGSAEFVLDALDPADPSRADVHSINDAARMAAALTRQLLIFSRLQPSQPEIIDVGEVVADTERLLRRTIGADIEFVVQTEPDLDLVTIDRSRLEQIILNFVVNARAAMPDGGRLTVSTAAADHHDLVLRNPDLAPGRFVRLTVADTGCGMSPEVAQKAFEPFFTTKDPGKGTGLGLATVYGAVQEAAGALALESEPGKGTRISIYLPSAARPEAPVSTVVAVNTDPTSTGEHVLVVDDNDALRGISKRILLRAGYHVTEASTRDDAVRLGGDTDLELDMVLTDVVMPGISAHEMIDAIRAHRPSISVALMSGYADPARGGRLLSDDIPIIAKPFNAATLLHEVRMAIDHTPSVTLPIEQGPRGGVSP
ncbi:hybrid sensor histidine kinase/response regulator [Actinoplanes solisilvae]|uniref:hybrid sensor histidine kinase/response regulator n=1 Tax=Actinoplanes solisilvae TaxID=2486853 RepID=UPI000FD7B88E|nr:response regulator [Actinoplanes solisilvae]